MMLEFLAAAALMSASLPAQDPAPAAPGSREALPLADVTVTGRPLDRLIEDFVLEVAEPNRRYGLARWDTQVCVGAANLQQEAGQYLIDRVSTVARDLGLRTGAPGCTPNILVVATDDAGALARSLVNDRPRAFRMGGGGMDRGGAALADFITTDRPVRWWQMAMPTNSSTGDRATRIPGECQGNCLQSDQFAPNTLIQGAARLRTQIVDNLIRAIVIVDIDQVDQLTALQLADYIAMVSLAQIDPNADTRAYASILNVFQDPTVADSLMDWDKAYLDGLYAAERNSVSRSTNRREVIDGIRDAHQTLRESQDDAGEGVID